MLDQLVKQVEALLEEAGFRRQAEQGESGRIVTWRNSRDQIRLIWEGNESRVALEGWDGMGKVTINENLSEAGCKSLVSRLRLRLAEWE